jgi:hypothetical protein
MKHEDNGKDHTAWYGLAGNGVTAVEGSSVPSNLYHPVSLTWYYIKK